jgi:hypothetical protein
LVPPISSAIACFMADYEIYWFIIVLFGQASSKN